MEQENKLAYDAIIAQLQAENEHLREKLADSRLKGYYQVIGGMDELKKALRGLHVSSFFVGYFVALGVMFFLTRFVGE